MTVIGIFLRGVLMGASDVVPGVSGGTMAFITGIYGTLLDSIRSVDVAWVKLVFAGRFVDAWEHINGRFLLALLLGIVAAIASLARVLTWLLEHHPVPLWAFFFGLILASALILMRQVQGWNLARVMLLGLGVAVAVGIGLAPRLGVEVSLPVVFFSGFLAICAMILPGISGSFILVLLGMYAPVLAAVRDFDVLFLLVLALGAGGGLLCFSRLLHWLLSGWHEATMALLTGFLFGSLTVVWPWKRVLEWYTGSQGQLKPSQQVPVSPAEFHTVSGQEPQVALCVLLILVGFTLVWFIDRRWGKIGEQPAALG